MNDTTFIKNAFKELNDKLWKLQNIDNGVFGGIHEKYWVECNKKQFLFKYNQSLKDFSAFGEVFTYYLSLVLGFKCVKSVFCKDLFNDSDKNGVSGVLIESYRTKDVLETASLKMMLKKYKRRHFAGLTVREIVEICKEFADENDLTIDRNLEQELKEMALLDYLLFQIDRHAGNIEFLIKQVGRNKKLILAPMFDNAYCLFVQNNMSSITKILNEYKAKTVNNVGLCVTNPKPQFYIEKSEEVYEEGESIVRDLASEILNNNALKNLYEKFIKLNFEEELNYVNSLALNKLPDNYKMLAKTAVKHRVKLLKEEILKQDLQNFKKEGNHEYNITL